MYICSNFYSFQQRVANSHRAGCVSTRTMVQELQNPPRAPHSAVARAAAPQPQQENISCYTVLEVWRVHVPILRRWRRRGVCVKAWNRRTSSSPRVYLKS